MPMTWQHHSGERSIIGSLPFPGKTVAGALILGALALGAPAPSRAATELPALAQAPQIPVSALRQFLPDHPGPADIACVNFVFALVKIRALAAIRHITNVPCLNTDIAVYQRNGRTFVVQGSEDQVAWTHFELTDPANSVIVGQFAWPASANPGTSTTGIEAFRQGAADYLAMALERTDGAGACGVVIADVTNGAAPAVVGQFIGADWCDSHNVFVETDASGDGSYVFATANATADLRVLAINDPALGATVANPVEVGAYRRSDRHPVADSDLYDDAYVHDVTVAGGTVYAAYWNKGVDILDADLIRQPGVTGLLADETAAGNVRPAGFAPGTPFLAHQAVPNGDGSLVFVQDNITSGLDAGGNPVTDVEPVQMWTTAGVPAKADGLLIDDLVGDAPVSPAHGLEINFGLQPNRLYVSWYRLGLQAWDFAQDPVSGAFGFVRAGPEPRTAAAFHQVREDTDAPYSGTRGLRTAEIGGQLYAFQSDQTGLIVSCLGDGTGGLSGCPPDDGL